MTNKEIKEAFEYWKEFDNEIDDLIKIFPYVEQELREQRRVVRVTLKALDAIKSLEHKEGEWIAHPDRYEICATEFECSCCHESFVSGELTDEQFIEMMRYCPNCGAKKGKINDRK